MPGHGGPSIEEIAALQRRFQSEQAQARGTEAGPPVRRGSELFDDGPYPRTWDGFIGQEKARQQLFAAARSAKCRGERMGHTLLASGLHGIGKSALARLIAHELGAGMVTLSDQITVDDAAAALSVMSDRDVLFIDEVHQTARTGGWLLHLLQDAVLRTGRGTHRVSDVTVIAATTDAQLLPETILSRFQLAPVLVGYTDEEGVRIAAEMASRLHLYPSVADNQLRVLAGAANNVPRVIGTLLESLRDTRFAPDGNGRYDLSLALEWNGLTRDGLNRVAQAYLLALLHHGRASKATLHGLISEPGPLRHTEKLLTSRGLVTIESDGRRLTAAGVNRARQLEAAR